MMKMPASSKKGGMCFGFPDVCKTPGTPVPIPYPNFGLLNGCDKTIAKVLVEHKETVVETSRVPMSQGDEPGTLKGVVSQDVRGEVGFKTYSSKVYARGKKMVFHTAVTTHNGSNPNLPAGCHMVPSQSKVLVSR